jgi:hypothetical protein
VVVDVVVAGAYVVGISEGDDLTGDREGGGKGVSGEEDLEPPSIVMEVLDDVLEADRLRVGGERWRAGRIWVGGKGSMRVPSESSERRWEQVTE